MNPQALITETLGHLDWCTTVPHTIGHIVKLQAQRNAAERTRFTHGMSNDEILSALTSRLDSSSGKGGHSDPTADAALAGFADDEDETIGSLHHACQLIRDSAEEAHHLTAVVMRADARTFPPPTNLLETLNDAQAHLICLREIVPDDPPDHLVWLLREPICGTAAWLRQTCEAIYLGTRLEERDQPQQKPITECRICAEYRRGTIAVNDGRCAECARFQSEYKCHPTEEIVRQWDYGRQRLTLAMIDRARQAKAKRKVKAS